MVEEAPNVGDPWSVLPVKNAKQARDLVEVHLSDRALDLLERFEDFPNLEVVWLNNNRLRHLDGLARNFRIKCVYCANNALEDVAGIRKFKFLNTLLLGGNRLRGLDAFLAFLGRFAFLEHLELTGNPLSEEPDYRLKLIRRLPQVQVLDRHPVTAEERRKAAALDAERKQQRPGKPQKAVRVSQALSKGEQDLFREVAQIGMRTEQQLQAEEQKRLSVSAALDSS